MINTILFDIVYCLQSMFVCLSIFSISVFTVLSVRDIPTLCIGQVSVLQHQTEIQVSPLEVMSVRQAYGCTDVSSCNMYSAQSHRDTSCIDKGMQSNTTVGPAPVTVINGHVELSCDIKCFCPQCTFSLNGSGSIMHCTISDVQINYIKAISEAD